MKKLSKNSDAFQEIIDIQQNAVSAMLLHIEQHLDDMNVDYIADETRFILHCRTVREIFSFSHLPRIFAVKMERLSVICDTLVRNKSELYSMNTDDNDKTIKMLRAAITVVATTKCPVCELYR